MPYKRTTQRQKWIDKNYKKYQEWKKFLQYTFRQQNGFMPQLEGAYFVEVMVYYKDKRHGDTDNVVKGINDALFKNDKFVSGSYRFEYANSGGIKVKIYERN